MGADNNFTLNTAEIVAVGTELLLGQTVNTNAALLAKNMSDLGLNVFHMSVIGDNHKRLAEAIRLAVSRSDLVLISGGLGPTDDDITMRVAAEVAKLPLSLDENVWKTIQSYFSSHGHAVTDNNKKQAMLPEGQTVLPNRNGTAPGSIIVTKNESGQAVYLVLLPGPPAELNAMFQDHVRPWLEGHTEARFSHTYIRLVGIGESAVEAAIADLIESQRKVTIAPYASAGHVVLRITERLHKAEKTSIETQRIIAQIKQRLGSHIYEVGERDIAHVIRDLFIEKQMTIATAESITGGRIAAELTRYPASSSFYRGSVVSYSKDSKIRELGVDKAVLDRDGAVNETVARQMAEGVRARFDTTIGVSITGLAGPGRGEETVDVGSCYIGIAIKNTTTMVYEWTGWGRREKIMRRAVMQTLMRIWEVVR